MSEFALIDATPALLRTQIHADQPPDPVGKGWRWVPVSRITGTGGSYLENDIWVIETPAPSPPPPAVSPNGAQDRIKRLLSRADSRGNQADIAKYTAKLLTQR